MRQRSNILNLRIVYGLILCCLQVCGVEIGLLRKINGDCQGKALSMMPEHVENYSRFNLRLRPRTDHGPHFNSDALLVLTARTPTSGMQQRKPWRGLAIGVTRYE